MEGLSRVEIETKWGACALSACMPHTLRVRMCLCLFV